MTVLNFTDGFNRHPSLTSLNTECINAYPKIEQIDAETSIHSVLGTPGLVQLATTGGATEKNRGRWRVGVTPYTVNGTTLYRVNADFTTTSLGTVTGSRKVSMRDNGIQLMILVPGGNGYIFNQDTAVFAQITDSDFTANGAPQYLEFIDSFFMVTTDTKKFIISAANDGTSWNALDFGVAESDPDVIIAPVNFKNEVYILGSETVEGQDNVGGSDFPFVRSGLFLDKGLFAPLSLIKSSSTFSFIGGGRDEAPAIWQFNGGDLIKISNTGIDLLLQDLDDSELTEVVGYSYSQDGSTFLCWDLPNEAICYESPRWHLRRSDVTDGAGNVITTGWRATLLQTAYSKLLAYDREDGRIGEVLTTVFDEYGMQIKREVDTREFTNGQAVFSVPRFEVGIEAGVGDNTTTDPQIRMKKSDNAKIFRVERNRSMGAQGKLNKRAVWKKNGRFRQRAQFKILMSDPVKFAINSVDAEFVGGRV